MHIEPALPDGLRTRPIRPDDLAQAVEIAAACEMEDSGTVEIDPSDLETGWARPEFDLDTMSIAVLEDDRMLAFGEVFRGRSEVDVHPNARGRGIGSALMRWSWEVARSTGSATVGQTISDARRDAISLFLDHGYEISHSAWLLQTDLADSPSPPLPDGFGFRDFAPGADEREVFDVIDTAFSAWEGRDSDGFDNWRAQMLDRPEVRPDILPLAVDASGAIVGVAIGYDYGAHQEGWVQQLAVADEHQGKGIGRALLGESFRRFREVGRTQCGLSTDSRTGALGLYERVGMHVRASYTRYTKTL
jgi:mycothiol synthase